MEMLNTISFTEHDGQTTLNLRSVPFGASPEERTFFVAAFDPLRQGFGGTYDQLADYLAKSA